MKFKKLCTVLTLLTTISLVGCDKKVEEVSTELSNETIQKIDDIAANKEEIGTPVENVEEEKTTSINEESSDTPSEQVNGRIENDYFTRIYGFYKEDLDKIKEKNESSSFMDTFYIYDHNSADDPDNFYDIGSIDISKDLSLKEKLTLLCAQMEEAYKTESGDEIAIEIVECIGDDVAVVNIVERYPMHNYMHRGARLEYTLNYPKSEGIDWFDSVVVVYDCGASQ